MANTKITSLLSKKGWTGKEVGKLLIASLLNDLKNQRDGTSGQLFSQADFDRMVGTLTKDSEYTTYGVYRDVYSLLVDGHNAGEGMYQQFYNGFSRLLLEVRELQNSENAQQSLENTPLIVTESQYTRLTEEATTSLRAHTESFSSLVFSMLDYFLDNEEEAPEGIRTALEACKEKPATGNRFLPLYNETYGEGYTQLPDGRRSDQMDSEEWRQALEEEFARAHPDYVDAVDGNITEAIRNFNYDRLIQGYELYFYGAEAIRDRVREATGKELECSDEEIEGYCNTIIDGLGGKKGNPDSDTIEEVLGYNGRAEWHYYEQPPEGLTLYDLLELYSESSKVEATERDAIKHLKADAPDLYNALKAYIEEFAPKARGLKANQLHKSIATWGELADSGNAYFQELITPRDSDIIELFTTEDTAENYYTRLRIAHSGIAVLQNPAHGQVIENGDYKEPKNPILFYSNILSLENNGEKIAELHDFVTNLIEPSLRFLYSLNALISIFGKVYDIPDIELALYDVSIFEEKVEALNRLIAFLYHDVYGNKAERERKQAIIKDALQPIKLDTLKPEQERVDELREQLVNMGFSSDARKKLKNVDALINQISYREGGM